MPRRESAELEDERAPVRTSTGRRGVANWPIQRKLIALVTIPLLIILSGGAYLGIQNVGALRAAQDSRDVAIAINDANQLSSALRIELNDTLRSQALQQQGWQLYFDQLRRDRPITDQAVARMLNALAHPPQSGWSQEVLDAAALVQGSASAQLASMVESLAVARKAVPLRYQVARRAPNVLTLSYTEKLLDPARALSDALIHQLNTTSTEGRVIDAASTLLGLTAAASSAQDERTATGIAIEENRMPAKARTRIETLLITQSLQFSLASIHATPAVLSQITVITEDTSLDDFRTAATTLNEDASKNLLPPLTGGETQAHLAARELASSQDRLRAWWTAADARLDTINALVTSVASATEELASANAQNALIRTVSISGLALLTLLIVSLILGAIGRTITSPLRRLRAGAVEAATVRLPSAVRQIEREGPDAAISVPPVLAVGGGGGPETLEVAQAVDGLTNEAIRLATVQVRLRRALDDAFVSMSRRSQSMVEKQLSIIDELESSEEDPEQLRHLFRLDHLAARMRRYNDNLLVLAGSAVRTRSTAPVPIADVFRAATSEMEQYERVRLQPLGGVSISGPAAGGLIHLLAELLDNAAMYSPPTSAILLSSAFANDGSLRIEVTDSGVGVPPAELADLNARLAMPGNIDTQVPSRMGLYVVAKLAQRGGLAVRLSPRAQAAGTVAEVLVPTALVIGAAGRLGHLPTSGQGPRQPQQPGYSGQPGQPGQPGPGLPPLVTGGIPRLSPRSPLRSAPNVDVPAAQTITPMNGTHAEESLHPSTALPPAPSRINGLPSRRPGAALSQGPLGGQSPTPLSSPRNPAPFSDPADGSAPTAFDAFGVEAPAAPATGPSGLPIRAPGASQPESLRPGKPTSPRTPAAPSDLRPRTHSPTRPPYRPGATGAQAGASAATAAAAAARARTPGSPGSPTAKSGRPGSALFAATGPATFPGGLPRVTPAAGEGASTGSLTAGLAGTPAAPLSDPKPRQEATPEHAEPALPVSAPVREPVALEDSQPTELAALAAVRAGQSRYQPVNPDAALIGSDEAPEPSASTPIFDAISVWFSADSAGSRPDVQSGTDDVTDASRLIDLRQGDREKRPVLAGSGAGSSSRWSSLGDQRWTATNARAAASPEVAGNTGSGLPRRRPGANLLPSAVAAAPQAPVVTQGPKVDPEAVRGRLGSYQRGLTSARRARTGAPPEDAAIATQQDHNESGITPGGQEGDQ